MNDSAAKDLRERVIRARKDELEALRITSDFEPLVKKCIRMYVKDPGSFEDAMQEGRHAILGCIKKYDISSPVYFEGYVKMAVIYCIRDFGLKHRENESLDEELTGDGGSLYNILDSGMDIERDEIRKERLSSLKAALNKLSEREREVIHEFYFEGKTMREMSRVRRCHYMTVVSQKDRVLKKLRQSMGE